MKRRDELLVGFTVLMAVLTVVAAAMWLSESGIGATSQFYTARFSTVGGLGVGNPVVLRGVRVGRVSRISLGAENWVNAELQIYQGTEVPDDAAVMAAPASLFGEWHAEIISLSDRIDDPNVRRELQRAAEPGDELWPGATLPDIGQLTAQAGRIASDIATVAGRVQTAIDSTAVSEVQGAFRDFASTAREVNVFADQQADKLDDATTEIVRSVNAVARAAAVLEETMARIDTATANGEVEEIVDNVQVMSADIREAVASIRELAEVIQSNQASFQRIIQGTDSVVTRLQSPDGTVGRLVSDSTLYVETLNAVRSLQLLVNDIAANPRKYFKFSVF